MAQRPDSPHASSSNQAPYLVPDTRKLQRHRRARITVHSNSGAEIAIIKTGKVMYWDDSASPGTPGSKPRISVLRRPEKVWLPSWRAVSGILLENGELRLVDEGDSRMITAVHLSQLPTCAIQQLHASVLRERFCIGIFLHYAIPSGASVPSHPLYISLDSRIVFETWFVLFRAFTIPELYGPEQVVSVETTQGPRNVSASPTQDMFRLDRSLFVRVIQARLYPQQQRNAVEGSRMSPPVHADSEGNTIGVYFTEVVIDGAARARTMLRRDAAELFWRDEFEFWDLPRMFGSCSIVLKRGEMELSDMELRFIDLEAVQSFSGITICGKVDIDINESGHDFDKEAKYPIVNEQLDVIGEMLLRTRSDELVVLMLDEYLPLSELLHNFPSGLAAQIAHAMPRSLQRLPEVLINIFQASGKISAWLMHLAKTEIEGDQGIATVSRTKSSGQTEPNTPYDDTNEREQVPTETRKLVATDVNLLFRGNSLFTRSVDLYMRRIGREYLEEVLVGPIADIVSKDLDCEIDGSRVSQMTDFNANWGNFISSFRRVWEAIYRSSLRCPRDMRLLFRHIRFSCKAHFDDAASETMGYRSISAFIFLRFFCAALLNPKIFNLIPDHPPVNAKRTLTLIAKCLMGVANMTHFGAKEQFLERMNVPLEPERQKFKDFIDSICSVSPDQQRPQPSPHSYAVPRAILARLPPTHRESFPSLPYLIDEARNYASLVNLWLDSDVGFKRIQGTKGDLSRFHDVCVHLRRRTEACVAKAQNQQEAQQQLNLVTSNLTSSTINDHHPPSTPTSTQVESPTTLRDDRGSFSASKRKPVGVGSATVDPPTSPSSSSSPLNPRLQQRVNSNSSGLTVSGVQGPTTTMTATTEEGSASSSTRSNNRESFNAKQRFGDLFSAFRKKGR